MLGLFIVHGLLIILFALCFWRWLGEDLIVDLGSWALFSEFLLFILYVGCQGAWDVVFVLDLGCLRTVVSTLTINVLFCFDELTGFFMGILIVALSVCFYFLVDYFEFDVNAGSIFALSFLFSQLALTYFCAFDLFAILFFWEAISLVSFFLIQY
jgi:NADH:ubiquinone oxidoreductase subunit 5 (subunit L)/multisubunit Na+/H+ antiporter MnhA subunit